MMKKKPALILTAVMMLSLLAGCGGKNEEPTPSTDAPATEEPAAPDAGHMQGKMTGTIKQDAEGMSPPS